MLLPLLSTLGLFAQHAEPPKDGLRPADPGVRIWVSDSLYQVGAGARVYVKLREPGYLMVLHVDALGRIRVLYPATPDNQVALPAGAPFEVNGADSAATFRVGTRGRGTLLAARSPAPFHFDPLRRGSRWDYDESLLLQPTAGNAFAAVLDIADRVADGQPYDYDVTAYGTPGVLSQRTASDTVCFSCLTARHPRSSSRDAGGYGNGALAIDHSYAAANNSSVVDCSGANLVDSFCGVQDNSVTNVYSDNSVTETNTVEVPVYVPFFVPFRHVRRTPPAPPLPPPAITIPKPLRRVSTRIVPPPPRPRPEIVVIQPTAPSHPQLVSDQPDAVATVPVAAPPARVIRQATARPAATAASVSGMRTGSMASTATFSTPMAAASAATIARPGLVAPRTFVPSRALLRAINSARH